jgi:arabinan endo-1,5-alpha-L-arabinosidase
MKKHSTFLLLSLLTLSVARIAVISAPAATLSGATGAHDPSRMIWCSGKYYVYSTGGGMKFSSDGIIWATGPSPFAEAAPTAGTPAAGAPPAGTPPPGAPSAGSRRVRRGPAPSVAAIVPVTQGIWAPDVIFYNHKYYLYYSVAAPAAGNHCAIGLLTSPTLDPSSPDYKWTDAGVVVSTRNKVEKKAAIDPCPFVDARGNLWLSWGSGYANGNGPNDPTIVICRLDNATGLLSTTDKTYYPVAPGHIEASYVQYHAGYYYAFWNSGGCCSGTNSTYRIHVARSASPTGPYLNKAGKEGEGDTFLATDKDHQLYGPGQIGIDAEPGLDRFSFHYYNAAGRPVLGFRTLVWGPDGWPSVGEDLSPGTYKITSDSGLALGVRGAASADGAPIDLQPYTGNDYQKWTVAVTPDGHYQLTSVGSGKCFGISPPSAGPKNTPAVIDQAAAGTGGQQQWIIELTSDGKAYRLTSSTTQQVLALPVTADGTSGKSATLTTASWSNISAQKWTISAP